MFILCNLSVLMLMLTLHGQVRAGKIIGGHVAVPHSRPYMALLEITTHGNKMKYCDGFLVSEDFVMTAAHCHEKSYTVLLGLHNATIRHYKEVQILSVDKAFPHKGYNAAGFKNDIMLLKLTSSAKLSKNVQLVPMANKTDGLVPKSCVVCGWGRTDRANARLSDTLMEVNVTLVDNKLCGEESDYCSKGMHGPGPGDSGGPLVCEDGRVYGVVSASRKSSHSYVYKYTNIPENRDWIDNIMIHDE
ncbi:mast cell protease 2-like [Cololabis saira]|uniref:mast cell protease 2-like n=1 Tax=Cololabis saira TaxID=129043 RepID=UPI002AD513D3|nr:mast cell protease 2-like [Cololabis saira]